MPAGQGFEPDGRGLTEKQRYCISENGGYNMIYDYTITTGTCGQLNLADYKG